MLNIILRIWLIISCVGFGMGTAVALTVFKRYVDRYGKLPTPLESIGWFERIRALFEFIAIFFAPIINLLIIWTLLTRSEDVIEAAINKINHD